MIPSKSAYFLSVPFFGGGDVGLILAVVTGGFGGTYPPRISSFVDVL